MNLIKRIINTFEYRWARSSNARFTAWLKKKGCTVGERVRWYSPKDTIIDVTRPSLIEIGSDVSFTSGCIILTHGADWHVLRNLFGEVIASSGKVKIGNNVFIGMCSIILKGVTIGENCIIGARSVVTKDIPPNSVVAGNPARVICSIADYYLKRKSLYVTEAKSYARSIKENLKREPRPSDFWEEFPLFLKGDEALNGAQHSVKHQLGLSYENYIKTHKPHYDNFEAFMIDSGVLFKSRENKE